MNTNRFANAGFKVFITTAFLTPFFFIPWNGMTVDFAKVAVMALGLSITLLLLGWHFFKNKVVPMPKALIMWSVAGILLNMAVSTVISSSWYRSLIAQGTETTTLAFVLVLFLALYISSVTLSGGKRIGNFVGALFVGYILGSAVSIVRLFVAADTFNLGVLTMKTSSLFGSWFDLALWSAFIVIISGWALVHRAFPRVHKLLWAVYVIALAWLVIVNAFPAWCAVAASAVVYVIFDIKNRTLGSNFKRAMVPVYIPAIIAIVFFIFGQTITNSINSSLNIANNGIEFNRIALSLPLKESVMTASDVLSASPIFGAHPARFSYAYLQYKPTSVNTTNAWSVEFTSAYGYFLDSIIEQGILGGVFWLLFTIGLIILVVKALNVSSKEEDPFNAFALKTSAYASILGIVCLVLFMPAQATMLLIFLSFGWLIASLVMCGKLDIVSSKSEVKNKIIVVLLLLLALSGLYLYGCKIVSTYYFLIGKQALVGATPDITKAHEVFRKVTQIEGFDLNYQALAQLAIYSANNKFTQLSNLQNSTDPNAKASQADLVKGVQEDITESISAARMAVSADQNNYYNFITEARISSALINIQVQNAKENAIQAYVKALELNPNSPNLLLEVSQLAYDIGDYDAANKYLHQALAQKPDYIDAVFLLTQTQIKQGQVNEAIISATTARDISPNEPILYLQLGLLRYYNKEYNLAIESFQKAVSLVPDYANAHYFLGLSYSKVGKVAEAIKEFEIVEASNKDNTEVQSILKNLRSGKAPFPNGNRFDNVISATSGQSAKPPVSEKSR